LTQEEADTNVFQFHTIAAWDAWLRCREAREKVKDKQMQEEQANLVCAEASEKDALLAKTTAIAMLENPLSDHLEWEQMLYDADRKLLQSQVDWQAAVDAGAVPSAAPEALTGVTFVEPVPVPTETTFDTTTRETPIIPPISPIGATNEGG
jgi:hypothetical protein